MKKLLIIIAAILLFSTNVYSTTKDEFIGGHEDAIIEICEEMGENYGAEYRGYKAEIYGCMLEQFYGLHKIIMYIDTLERSSEDWKVFIEILDSFWISEKETYDFKQAHLEFEAYLEEKE